MIPRKIICANCGNETVATGPRTKYCPLCAYRIRLEKQNAKRSGGRRADPAHTKIITCAICGKEFEVNAKAARAKFCPECSGKAFKSSKKKHREKEKRWLLEEPRSITCERCGVEVVLTDARQFNRKYCDDCQKIVYAELRKKAKDAQKERGREKQLDKRRSPFKGCGSKSTKKPRVSQIEAIQKAAHAAGMSYGKYQAMLAMQAAKKGVSRR